MICIFFCFFYHCNIQPSTPLIALKKTADFSNPECGLIFFLPVCSCFNSPVMSAWAQQFKQVISGVRCVLKKLQAHSRQQELYSPSSGMGRGGGRGQPLLFSVVWTPPLWSAFLCAADIPHAQRGCQHRFNVALTEWHQRFLIKVNLPEQSQAQGSRG